MNNRKFLPLIFIGIVALFLVIYLSSSIFKTLQPGERGVIFRKFTTGLDKDNIIPPGFIMIWPWNEMYRYDVKEHKIEERMDVLDKNGLTISVDVSVRYHPIYDRIGYLHENFGADYVNRLIIPEARSNVRRVMGRYSAQEIYSTKRSEVEAAIITEAEEILRNENNNIAMKALLIRSIILPVQIKQAIENKLEQEQVSKSYIFRLDKEKSEADRKRIAAEGEAAANTIVNRSLTDRLLKMRGIEATIELAKSPNSKVVIIGGGGEGMPLILGGN